MKNIHHLKSQLGAIFCRHQYWPVVLNILQKLSQNGFLSYLSGGCIRDALLGKSLKDFDVATSAKPEEVIRLFPNSNKQGKAFGVVVVQGEKPFCRVEVATFRKDGPYKDGRHPQYVTFLSDKEDALRRDFTINALFYSWKTGQVIDYVGGLKDLQNKIIRTVGIPKERFEEDKLRIIRALRFQLQLDFELHTNTKQAVYEMQHGLWDIARERVYEECLKMLKTEKFSGAMSAFRKLNLLAKIYPSGWQEGAINWEQCMSFWHRIETAKDCKILKKPSILWVRALYPLLKQAKNQILNTKGKWTGDFNQALKAWKFSSSLIRQINNIFYGVCCLLPVKSNKLDKQEVSLIKKLRVLDSGFSKEILFLCRIDLSDCVESMSSIDWVEKEFQKRADCDGHLPAPLVNGDDLKSLGVQEDKNMAYYLDTLYDQQIEKQIIDKKVLLNSAKCLLSKGRIE